MSVIEIIAAFLLILACVFIVVIVLLQESKQGMSNVITGGGNDNYYQKNSGRTREAKLARATKTAAVAVFVIAILVNVISVYFSGKDETELDTNPIVVTTPAENTEAPETAPSETDDTTSETDVPDAADSAETEANPES